MTMKTKNKTTALFLSLLLLCVVGVITYAFISSSQKEIKKEQANIPFEKGKITIDKKTHDFGTISEDGGEVKTSFSIQNNMEEPILISQVRASCGCTTPQWTKEPIPPGGIGEIEVSFNPRGRSSNFNKSITILTNGDPGRIVVRITGTIESQSPSSTD